MKRANPLVLLWMCIMFFMTHVSYTQKLAQPKLKFSKACASVKFNTYDVEVISEEGGFDADNIFIIELSDHTGGFGSPIILKQISGKNSTLNFTTSVSFASTIYGENYVIRVRSTKPERISSASKTFPGYYLSNIPLVLENFKDVTLCKGSSTSLSLDATSAAAFKKFNWYFNEILIKKGGSSLGVKNPGRYFAKVYYGACTNDALISSNRVTVSTMESLDVNIKGPTEVSKCANESYTLESSIQDLANDYYWYKNGSFITGISSKEIKHTVTGALMYGKYTLRVKINGCEVTSKPVSIVNQSTDFTVAAVGDTENIIVFPGGATTLKITTTAVGTVVVKWYKDETLLPTESGMNIKVSEEGKYRAQVSVSGSTCAAQVSSPVFKVYNPNAYFLSLKTADNYTKCVSSSVVLKPTDIKYGISTGQKFILDLDKYGTLNYTWFYKENVLSGKKSTNLLIDNSELNGAYKVKVYDANNNFAVSNTIQVSLSLANVLVLGDEKVYLCLNDPHTFKASIDNPKYTYTWFKNELKINSLPAYSPTYSVDTDVFGDYKVEIKNTSGCTSASNVIQLLSSSASFNVIANGANIPIILFKGDTRKITISTSAISPVITWYKDGYEVPGSNSLSLSVSQAGKYRAKVEVADVCGQSVFSDYFKVVVPQDFEVTVKTDSNYEACSAVKVTLSIGEFFIKIIGSAPVSVKEEEYAKFTFAWIKNGNLITAADGTSLALNSEEDSGSYQLKIVSKSGISATSSERQIKMELEAIEIHSKASNSTICKGNSTRLYAIDDPLYSYQWYYNDTPLASETLFELSVNSSGDYYVRVSKNNCSINSNTISIASLDEDVIQISPSDLIFITDGETATVTASGGDSYLWQNDVGEVLSKTASLIVSKEGKYVVIAKLGACEFVKTIEVSFKRSTLVPNIVSPNNDGVNDTWALPHGYAFNKDVEVKIFNANGVVVFTTTDYQNNWPEGSLNNMPSYTLFYYVIKQGEEVVKKGTITIIK